MTAVLITRSVALFALAGLLEIGVGRVYAAYGGVFVILSLLWGWWIDGRAPDRFDVVGAGLCLVGVAVIMYWPRGV